MVKYKYKLTKEECLNLQKVKVYLNEEQDHIVLESDKELSINILKEFTAYRDNIEDGIYFYFIPCYSSNMFALACLISKYNKIFECPDELLEAIKEEGRKAPVPICSVHSDNIKVVCPPITAYNRLMQLLNASRIMMNTWRIPFSRLYDTYNQLIHWQHPFLPKFRVAPDLQELITFPIADKFNMESLSKAKVNELYSIYYGYQVKPAGLSKLKYDTALDILLTRPLRYQDRTSITAWNQASFGKPVFIKGVIESISGTLDKRLIVELKCSKSDKTFCAVFFGGSWQTKLYNVGDTVYVQCIKIGRENANGLTLLSQEEVQAMPILPIYKQSPTNRITTKVITQCVRELFYRFDGKELSKYILGLSKPLWELIYNLHFPVNEKEYSDTVDELAYLELVYLQLLFIERKSLSGSSRGCAKVDKIHNYYEEAYNSLEFELTKGQVEALEVFKSKLQTENPEKMLLSADVGAGKTLCAQFACLFTADAGYQSVLVGPTEILATQLYETFLKLIKPLKDKPTIAFLSGKTKAAERKSILSKLANGEIEILVGTQAVTNITDWNNLGLIVIDEQQKFGASQREALLNARADGIMPDIISQTATPIPRTTALAFYGDIDLVPIKEKPKNRKPIITELVKEVDSEDFLSSYKGPEWDNILNELEQGRQMFIVAPAVDEEAKIISVKKIEKMLSRYSNIMKIKDISGKTSKESQNKILESFRNNEFNVLIASSIIEVGIDIPNATVIVIVGADRFGASSLHQIRGRVGRNSLQSYCYLVTDGDSESSKSRLQSLVDSNDGFYIALSDLSTRKEGDLLGTRQSGDSNLRFCELADHSLLIEKAREEAQRIFNNDKIRDVVIEEAKYFLTKEEVE